MSKLKTPLRVVKCGEVRYLTIEDKKAHYIPIAEDDCIVDADGVEVIGSSEWMRGSENLQALVDAYNQVNG